MRRRGLSDIGRTEEEVIFGEATSKDVITLLNTFKTVRPDDMSQSEKLRLLLLYAASHPNKAGGVVRVGTRLTHELERRLVSNMLKHVITRITC